VDLTGKYLLLELDDRVVKHFISGETVKEGEGEGETRWEFVGEVLGETPGVGLWFRIIGAAMRNAPARWNPQAKNVYLVRWDWISNALIMSGKPTNIQQVGFRHIHS